MTSPDDKGLAETCRLFVEKDEHKFSCAHMTIFPDGTKERLHGHNFRVGVAVEVPCGDRAPMLDFARIKGALATLCADLREHVLLPFSSPWVRVIRADDHEMEVDVCSRRYVFPTDEVVLLPISNVVVEQLAEHLWNRLTVELADDLRRVEALSLDVTVTEAAGQGATYRASLIKNLPRTDAPHGRR